MTVGWTFQAKFLAVLAGLMAMVSTAPTPKNTSTANQTRPHQTMPVPFGFIWPARVSASRDDIRPPRRSAPARRPAGERDGRRAGALGQRLARWPAQPPPG